MNHEQQAAEYEQQALLNMWENPQQAAEFASLAAMHASLAVAVMVSVPPQTVSVWVKNRHHGDNKP